MYKAIKNIGGYRIGDEVPANLAELWLEMYSVPQVEEVSKISKKEEVKEVEEVSEPEEPKEEPTEDSRDQSTCLLDDYISRNQSVVKKNILEDALSKNQLKQLLIIEKNNKNRPLVINTLKHKLKA